VSNVLGIWSDSLDHLVHLLVAFVLAALPIGWNRACPHGTQRPSPYIPAGCDGQLRPRADRDLHPQSHANILQGIVIGVGFSVRVPSLDRVTSRPAMPTAASVWVVGIISTAVGYGYYDIGIILAAVNLGTF
jgi:putative Mg2+ transporter-C (MgtC) family protein